MPESSYETASTDLRFIVVPAPFWRLDLRLSPTPQTGDWGRRSHVTVAGNGAARRHLRHLPETDHAPVLAQ
jgi:hypothetical protein